MHKHPARVQRFELAFGDVHVLYPEASEERCTAALLLDVDPVKLARKSRSAGGFSLQPYVNDRPYVASSFMSVAIAQVYGSALKGVCAARQELAETALPLTARLAVLPCRGGEPILRRLFEPLGYGLSITPHGLDGSFPEWGQSRYFTVELTGNVRLCDLLTHLYVLIPVLDDEKHYWVGSEEVEKLLARGEGWLAGHPERELIVQRYLRRQRSLMRAALAQLAEDETAESEDQDDDQEAKAESTVGLHDQRLDAVLDALKDVGAARVVDIGCGEGKLLQRLLGDKRFTDIVGMDVSHRRLEQAAKRLRLDDMPDRKRQRIRLIQGSLMYRDKRLAGHDAAAAVEVIEHLDPTRLAAFERVLFECAAPDAVVVTTPNREYNVMWPDLPAGRLRHADHRFEWTRAEFREWADRVSQAYGYSVRVSPLGPEDADVGAPSQRGVFTR